MSAGVDVCDSCCSSDSGDDDDDDDNNNDSYDGNYSATVKMIWIDNSYDSLCYIINGEDDEYSDNDSNNNFLIIQICWDPKQR